ncbi:MAG: licheninase [Actinoallomurus sp.]|nr:licheninase [Actinoallomurus sp.]
MSRVRPARRTLDSMRSLLVVLVAVAGLIAASTAAAPPGHAAPVLLSQGRPTTASSTENAGTPASSATDGDAGTRWSSAAADPQWVRVDLGSSSAISQVVLQWEAAYATAFQIQTSADGSNWSSV